MSERRLEDVALEVMLDLFKMKRAFNTLFFFVTKESNI